MYSSDSLSKQCVTFKHSDVKSLAAVPDCCPIRQNLWGHTAPIAPVLPTPMANAGIPIGVPRITVPKSELGKEEKEARNLALGLSYLKTNDAADDRR